MPIRFNKKNLLVAYLAFIISMFFYVSEIVPAYFMLVLSGCLIIYFSRQLSARGFFIYNNIILFLSVLVLMALFLYLIMFGVIEVKPYLEESLESERLRAIKTGGWILVGLIIGAVIGLSTVEKKSLPITDSSITVDTRKKISYLIGIAWIPIILNIVNYFLFFYGKPYVDVHTGQTGVAGLILKTIYFSFGALVNLGLAVGSSAIQNKKIRFLVLGFVLLFGTLLKLRSPLLFCFLIVVYFGAHKISVKSMLIGASILIVMFLLIALVRDNSLDQSGAGVAMLQMVVSYGDFVDTLIYAEDRLVTNGPLYGWGIVGSFFGVSEPLANKYAMYIAPEYFKEGGGFGFFILSDIVANFGVCGAFVISILIGIWITRFQLRSKGHFHIAIACILYASIFSFVRNDIGSTMRGVLYTVLSAVLIKILVDSVMTNNKQMAWDGRK